MQPQKPITKRPILIVAIVVSTMLLVFFAISFTETRKKTTAFPQEECGIVILSDAIAFRENKNQKQTPAVTKNTEQKAER